MPGHPDFYCFFFFLLCGPGPAAMGCHGKGRDDTRGPSGRDRQARRWPGGQDRLGGGRAIFGSGTATIGVALGGPGRTSQDRHQWCGAGVPVRSNPKGTLMRGSVQKKGKKWYAVVYDGIDPATGKYRRRWVQRCGSSTEPPPSNATSVINSAPLSAVGGRCCR